MVTINQFRIKHGLDFPEFVIKIKGDSLSTFRIRFGSIATNHYMKIDTAIIYTMSWIGDFNPDLKKLREYLIFKEKLKNL